MPVSPTWPKGLTLKHVLWHRTNAEDVASRTSGTALYVEPVTVDVPSGTQFVHVSFRTVHTFFGRPAVPADHRLKVIYFEITGEKYDELKKGRFSFEVRALLEGPAEGLWTPYFVLEVLCFG